MRKYLNIFHVYILVIIVNIFAANSYPKPKIVKSSNQQIAINNQSENNHFTDIFFVDELHGWALLYQYEKKQNELYKTINGGLEWSPILINETERLNSIYFVNAKIGWLAGGSGLILKTNDGGNSFIRQETGVTRFISSVYFANESLGFAVGPVGADWYDPLILRTNDGGISWDVIKNLTEGGLNDVFFSNDSTGWIVGESSSILQTNNAGKTWSLRPVGNTSNNSIFFNDENNGWMVGGYGSILYTSDGGITWLTYSKITDSYLKSVNFVDGRIGCIAGPEGTIIITRDAGKTWNLSQSNSMNYLFAAQFINQKVGWAVGEDNTMLFTINQGMDWQSFDVNNKPSNTIKIVSNFTENGIGSLDYAIKNSNNYDIIIFDTTTVYLNSEIICDLFINKDLTIIGPGANKLALIGTITISNNAEVNISELTVKGNFSRAIQNEGNLTIEKCMIIDSKANYGAGINNSGVLIISNSTISNNVAEGGHLQSGYGGGIYNSGNIKLFNTTITQNQCYGGWKTRFEAGKILGNGGGIYNSGKLEISNCSIIDNLATSEIQFGGNGFGGGVMNAQGEVLVKNSIIAKNITTNYYNQDINGIYKSEGYNLIGIVGDLDSGFINGVNGDIAGTMEFPLDPLVGALSNNGGSVLTIPLLENSPAINKAEPTELIQTDIRGYIRKELKDIGAYEFNAIPSVDIVQFYLEIINSNVRLNWITENEASVSGFNVYRNNNLIKNIPSLSTSANTKYYYFIDSTLSNDIYNYSLTYIWDDKKEIEFEKFNLNLNSPQIWMSNYLIKDSLENAKLSWSISEVNGLVGFEIYRNGELINVEYAKNSEESNTGYLFIDQIHDFGTYTYKVIALFFNGNRKELFSGDVNLSPTQLNNNYELYQNYPNPFNPTTTIRYTIPVTDENFSSVPTDVALNIYNVLGKKIKILIHEAQSPGSYEVTFDGINLTSGIYYYQLIAGDFIETKKMILLK